MKLLYCLSEKEGEYRYTPILINTDDDIYNTVNSDLGISMILISYKHPRKTNTFSYLWIRQQTLSFI